MLRSGSVMTFSSLRPFSKSAFPLLSTAALFSRPQSRYRQKFLRHPLDFPGDFRDKIARDARRDLVIF